MARPKKERIVKRPPLYSSFKPTGIMRSELQRITMSLDEYEAVRLADYMQMDHKEASVEMEISRSTFTRLLEKARKKLSSLLIEGKELCIEGGIVHFSGNLIRCESCGRMYHTGFEAEMNLCPHCGSADLLDMAGGYGHGNCCRRFTGKGKYTTGEEKEDEGSNSKR